MWQWTARDDEVSGALFGSGSAVVVSWRIAALRGGMRSERFGPVVFGGHFSQG